MAFDNITPANLGRGAIGTSVSTFYTAPTLTRTIAKCFDIVNTTAAAITVNLYLVPSGGTAGTSNALLYGRTVPVGGNVQWTGTQVLNAGDTVQINASAVGCTYNGSGGEGV